MVAHFEVASATEEEGWGREPQTEAFEKGGGGVVVKGVVTQGISWRF
jgi:hypothetical protein